MLSHGQLLTGERIRCFRRLFITTSPALVMISLALVLAPSASADLDYGPYGTPSVPYNAIVSSNTPYAVPYAQAMQYQDGYPYGGYGYPKGGYAADYPSKRGYGSQYHYGQQAGYPVTYAGYPSAGGFGATYLGNPYGVDAYPYGIDEYAASPYGVDAYAPYPPGDYSGAYGYPAVYGYTVPGYPFELLGSSPTTYGPTIPFGNANVGTGDNSYAGPSLYNDYNWYQGRSPPSGFANGLSITGYGSGLGLPPVPGFGTAPSPGVYSNGMYPVVMPFTYGYNLPNQYGYPTPLA